MLSNETATKGNNDPAIAQVYIPKSASADSHPRWQLNWLSGKRSTLSIKGGARPDFLDEEDEYDQASDTNTQYNNYTPEGNRGRPEPTYGVKEISGSGLNWSKNEIIIVSFLSTFVLLMLTLAILSAASRRRRAKKRKARAPNNDQWDESFTVHDLDIEDPAYWGGGRGVVNESQRGKSRKVSKVDIGVDHAGKGSSILSKDYKLAAMNMMNQRVTPDPIQKLQYGF